VLSYKATSRSNSNTDLYLPSRPRLFGTFYAPYSLYFVFHRLLSYADRRFAKLDLHALNSLLRGTILRKAPSRDEPHPDGQNDNQHDDIAAFLSPQLAQVQSSLRFQCFPLTVLHCDVCEEQGSLETRPDFHVVGFAQHSEHQERPSHENATKFVHEKEMTGRELAVLRRLREACIHKRLWTEIGSVDCRQTEERVNDRAEVPVESGDFGSEGHCSYSRES
jgi:hypothetical protein